MELSFFEFSHPYIPCSLLFFLFKSLLKRPLKVEPIRIQWSKVTLTSQNVFFFSHHWRIQLWQNFTQVSHKGGKMMKRWHFMFAVTSRSAKTLQWPLADTITQEQQGRLCLLSPSSQTFNWWREAPTETAPIVWIFYVHVWSFALPLVLLIQSFRWLMSHYVTKLSVSPYIYFPSPDWHGWKLQTDWCTEACHHEVVIETDRVDALSSTNMHWRPQSFKTSENLFLDSDMSLQTH